MIASAGIRLSGCRKSVMNCIQKPVLRALLTVSILLAAGPFGCGKNEVRTDLASLEEMPEEASETAGKSGKTDADSMESGETGKETEGSAGENDGAQKDRSGTVTVHVCGAVHNPGVYELPGSARIVDAMEAAGGLLEEADSTYLNQAHILTDEEQIYVPTTEEVESGTLRQAPSADLSGQDSKININTASKEDLMTLPGIGTSKAESIILYRTENGPFSSVEDLMQITGIKEGVFQKIKAYITV